MKRGFNSFYLNLIVYRLEMAAIFVFDHSLFNVFSGVYDFFLYSEFSIGLPLALGLSYKLHWVQILFYNLKQ